MMTDLSNITTDYNHRLNTVISLAWSIFKLKFINNRHFISTEAPFQHYFANIINQVGQLYCLTREDLFMVDLETLCNNVRGKKKYIDITCEFVNKINCGIELKFKTATQGAQDWGRIDIYSDIEALEIICQERFQLGKFYAITDSAIYTKPSKIGAGTVFATYNGYTTGNCDIPLTYPCKGREHIEIQLKDSYTFNWEKIANWYFLELTIQPHAKIAR